MTYLARSASEQQKPQEYKDHINGVYTRAEGYCQDIESFLKAPCTDKKTATDIDAYGDFYSQVVNAALYHDLGKLDEARQKVLRTNDNIKNKEKMPTGHEDAGSAYLKSRDYEAAILVCSHHRGLQDMVNKLIADSQDLRIAESIKTTDENLEKYLEIHNEIVTNKEKNFTVSSVNSLTKRIELSCLVDADYSDAGNDKTINPPVLWEKRLEKLTSYVDDIYETAKNKNENMTRNNFRKNFYEYCREHKNIDNIYYCDGPVGIGKTTALMANLLTSAKAKALRHIFVVVPFTNIITQTVEIYRKALVLEGENPEDIVAELDYTAEYSDEMAKKYAQIWKAPIIVTTAVEFFETLAAKNASKLRKLHELVGSAVIFDECHTMLPLKLLPLGWKWIVELSKFFGCNIILASGTLVHFWDEEFFKQENCIPKPLISNELNEQLKQCETRRLEIEVPKNGQLEFSTLEDLFKFSKGENYPQMFVFNRIETVALATKKLNEQGVKVIHLSTSFTPSDKAKIVNDITTRLEDSQDKNWVLVATKCVESGMNFSFPTAFCEKCSVQSLFQLSGRVSRNYEYANAKLYAFVLNQSVKSSVPKSFEGSIMAFDEMMQCDFSLENASKLSTEAFKREMKSNYNSCEDFIKKLNKDEKLRKFKQVADTFKVIEDSKCTAIIDENIVLRLENGEYVKQKEIYKNSVQISKSIIKILEIKEIKGFSNLYKLPKDGYDPNLFGYWKNYFDK